MTDRDSSRRAPLTAGAARTVAMGVVALLAIAGRAHVARAANEQRFVAHGTDQMYWIARVWPASASANTSGEPATNSSASARTVIQSRTAGGQRWHVLSRLDAAVVSMSHRAEAVAVLLDSGDWMLLWSGGGSIGKPLPGKLRMLALGGSNDALWAVGRGNLSALPPPTTQAATTSISAARDDDDDRPLRFTAPPGPATAPSISAARSPATGSSGTGSSIAPPAATSAAANSAAGIPAIGISATTLPSFIPESLGIFEFVGNAWILRGVVPDRFYAASPDDVSLTIAGSRPMLAVRDQERYLHVLSLNRDGRLDDLGHIRREEAPGLPFQLLGSGQPVLLWVGSGSAAGSIWRVDQLSDPPKVLTAPQQYVPGSPGVVTSALGSIRFPFMRENAGLEQTYSTVGEPRGQAQALPLLDSAPVERIPDWLVLPLLLLLVFLLFGPSRRRELTIGGPGPRPPGAGRMDRFAADDSERAWTARGGGAGASTGPAEMSPDVPQRPLLIAPIRLRFLAGVVDALPVIIVLFYMFATAQAAPPEEFVDIITSWRWYSLAATALYLLHTTIGELIAHRTFGKWIFGLRVTTPEGNRPGAAAILVRNLFRIIDVNLLFPLMLIALTPFHQRLGDVAARTIVVAEDWEGEDREEDEED